MSIDGQFLHQGKCASASARLALRPLVLGVLLAFGSSAAQASLPSPDSPLDAKATPAAKPVDLLLNPYTRTRFDATHSPLSQASADVQHVARWVIDSHDNAGLPFVLVDKVNAEVYAFDRTGQLRGAAPALLGMARGDHLMVPNTTQVLDVPPEARITPAGRFLSKLAIDSHNSELLVIDYDASISLHPVVKGTPEEHRAERLSSPTSQDNRISYGCINVPAAFYSTVVSPTFSNTPGVVYILPETESPDVLFGMQSSGGGGLAQRGSSAVSAQ